MAATSCGTEALMLGSLMMLASGCSVSLPSSARLSGTRCSSVRYSGNSARMRAGDRDVARLDLDAGRRGEGADDRQEGVGRQQRRLVGQRVDDGRTAYRRSFWFRSPASVRSDFRSAPREVSVSRRVPG